MMAVIEMGYLYYWCRTFFSSMDDGRLYRQRLAITAGMIALMLWAGHSESRELFAVLCGWAIVSEVTCAVCNVLDLDDRLFSRKAT